LLKTAYIIEQNAILTFTFV